MTDRIPENTDPCTKKKSFCGHIFHSMLFTGTFSVSVVYIMLVCDSIIAGHFFDDPGVAAVNIVRPAAGLIAFLSGIFAFGTSILYSREIGAMRKERAGELFGQGLILSLCISVFSGIMLFLLRDFYFMANGVDGVILELALALYRFMPLSAALEVLSTFLSQVIYADGDELCSTISYTLRIIGKIVFSIVLTEKYGISGIILGTAIGNALGILVSCWHFFRKGNTLHFVWHFSVSDMGMIVKFSIVEAVIYISWAAADFLLIRHVEQYYGDIEHIVLSVVIGLIEFGVVLDGVGLAVQPLLETYLGEKNHILIKRLMHIAGRAAVIEGLIANVIIFIFAKQFCLLFHINNGPQFPASILAVRIVSMGLVFCSALSLVTSYYMLIDHVMLSAGITIFKDGLLYSILPIICSLMFGINGMWAGLLLAPILGLIFSVVFIRFYYGKERFPFLLESAYTDIVVMDDTLTSDSCSVLSRKVGDIMLDHGCRNSIAGKASLFVEEIGLTILEKNSRNKKPVLIEISVLLNEGQAAVIERDSGIIFDITDTDLQIEGLSGYVLGNLMVHQQGKAHIITTGYNRNMIVF